MGPRTQMKIPKLSSGGMRPSILIFAVVIGLLIAATYYEESNMLRLQLKDNIKSALLRTQPTSVSRTSQPFQRSPTIQLTGYQPTTSTTPTTSADLAGQESATSAHVAPTTAVRAAPEPPKVTWLGAGTCTSGCASPAGAAVPDTSSPPAGPSGAGATSAGDGAPRKEAESASRAQGTGAGGGAGPGGSSSAGGGSNGASTPNNEEERRVALLHALVAAGGSVGGSSGAQGRPGGEPGDNSDLKYRSEGRVKEVPTLDLEEADNLLTVLKARSYLDEVILISTNRKMSHLAANMVLNLRRLGLEHHLVLADAAATCEELRAHVAALGCAWSSLPARVPQLRSNAAFALWTVRKHYVAKFASVGYNVFQTDTDVVWWDNPYPTLKTLLRGHSVVMQNEGMGVVPRANGGVLYVQNSRRSAGVAAWVLGQLAQRVYCRIAQPRRLNDLVPGLVGAAEHPFEVDRLVRATTDEQDLLNDVLLSGMANRSVSVFSVRAAAAEHRSPEDIQADSEEARVAQGKNSSAWEAIKAERRYQRIKAWDDRHAVPLSWDRDLSKAASPIPGPSLLCKGAYDQTIEYRPLYRYAEAAPGGAGCSGGGGAGAGQRRRLHAMKIGASAIRMSVVPLNQQAALQGPASALHLKDSLPNGTETAANAPMWLFAGRESIRKITETCGPGEVERRRFSERVAAHTALVSHLVGLGDHHARQLVMRALGAWHYVPNDAMPGHRQFPVSAARVLALAPAGGGPWGLGLASREQVEQLVRRLAALALVSGRIPAVPLLDCSAFRDERNEDPAVLQVPCPGSPVGCCLYLPRCGRDMLVHPPDLEYALAYLLPNETATVHARDLYAPAPAPAPAPGGLANSLLGKLTGAKAKGGKDPPRPATRLLPDTWQHGLMGAGEEAGVSEGGQAAAAGRVRAVLERPEATVVFLQADGLREGDGAAVLQALPAAIHHLEEDKVMQLAVDLYECPGLAEGRRVTSTGDQPRSAAHQAAESAFSPAWHRMQADHRNGSYVLRTTASALQYDSSLPLPPRLQEALDRSRKRASQMSNHLGGGGRERTIGEQRTRL